MGIHEDTAPLLSNGSKAARSSLTSYWRNPRAAEIDRFLLTIPNEVSDLTPAKPEDKT